GPVEFEVLNEARPSDIVPPPARPASSDDLKQTRRRGHERASRLLARLREQRRASADLDAQVQSLSRQREELASAESRLEQRRRELDAELGRLAEREIAWQTQLTE